MLSAAHIQVYYGTKHVLKDISLTLTAGKVIGIIGPNGSGKSTLVRALSGVIPLSGGEVRLEGQRLDQLSPLERARRMAVVAQEGQLPAAFTGWEVVLLGRTPHLNWLGQVSEHDQALARQAMRFTETEELGSRRVGECSGGERQRLLLARALAQEARILLMDEPTNHLDLHHQLNLLEKLRQLAMERQMAVLVTLHDINLVARFTDQVVLLRQGELKASGTPDQVLNPALLSETFQTPLEVVRIGPNPFVIPALR